MVTKFKKNDLIAVFAVILVSVLMIILLSGKGGDGGVALIRYEGGSLSVPLDKETSGTVSSEGYTMHYEVTNGSLSVTGCDCPDKTCVHTPAISKPGSSIVCMPAHIVITVGGGDGERTDVVAG